MALPLPAQAGSGGCQVGLAGSLTRGRSWVGLAGDNRSLEGCVGGEHALKANKMELGPWDQGLQALEEFQGSHDDKLKRVR